MTLDCLGPQVELHGFGPLAAPEVTEMIGRLSSIDDLLARHGIAVNEQGGGAGGEADLAATALVSARSIHRLFAVWIAEQRDNFSVILQRTLAAETWTPLMATQRVSTSVVDMFQCFSQVTEPTCRGHRAMLPAAFWLSPSLPRPAVPHAA